MEEETYEIRLKCGNCGHTQKADIPIGTTIVRYCIYHSCTHCGCSELQQDINEKSSIIRELDKLDKYHL